MRLSRLSPLFFLCAACNTDAPPASVSSGAPPVASAPSLRSASTVTSSAPVTTAPVAPPAPTLDEVPFAAQSNAFAMDLWARLRSRPGNLAVSPVSLSTALAMTWGGARGETATEMARVMHFAGSREAVLARAGAFVASANDPKRSEYTLRVANRLFADKSYAVDPAFVKESSEFFRNPPESVDFRGSAASARATMNGWAARATNDRIKDLVPPGGVGAATRLVLVNSIYFLGNWEHPFKRWETRPVPFHRSAGASIAVPTMHQEEWFRWAATDGLKLLEMPYVGGDLAMLFLLPDANDGLPDLEQRLGPDALVRWIAAMSQQHVSVAIPRFTIDTPPLVLRDVLVSMGMKAAFDRDAADLTGIANPPNPDDRLFIGDVFQKAFVKVDEWGTEASAGTAIIGTLGRGGPEFHADHPFLFLLRDTKSGMILFIGRVADPSKPR